MLDLELRVEFFLILHDHFPELPIPLRIDFLQISLQLFQANKPRLLPDIAAIEPLPVDPPNLRKCETAVVRVREKFLVVLDGWPDVILLKISKIEFTRERYFRKGKIT